MLDLEKVSGLPFSVGDDFRLHFRGKLPAVEPNVRTLKDMASVLMDPTATSTRDEMYYMYRNVHMPEHDKIIAQDKMTYDVTVIPPLMIGQEFNKTVGHYHAMRPGTHFAYPEIYEVLNGHALFLIQKMDESFKNLIAVMAFEARAGQKIIYPPNYGHIIVNIGSEVLVTANWVESEFERTYQQVSNYHGMAYYVVKNFSNGFTYIPNPHYKNHPPVRILTDKYMGSFKIMKDVPMYVTGTSDPRSLEFLHIPEKYAVELSAITS